MPDNTQRPTAELVEATRSHFSGVWANAHDAWLKVDSYFHRNYEMWPDPVKQRETYRPSTPTNVVDHAADTQLAFEPRVHREPAGDSDAHKQSADRLEVGLKAVMDDSALMEPSLIWKQIGRFLLHYGYGVVEGPLLNFGDKPKEPKRKESETDGDFNERMTSFRAAKRSWNPVRIRASHPSRVLLDPEEKQPSVAVRRSQMYVHKIHEMSVQKKSRLKYAEELAWDGKEPYALLTVTDYWSKYFHAFKVEGGQMLWVEKNLGGFVPYAHAFSGFGMEPVGQESSDPSHLAVGLLNPITDSLKLQAQRMAAQHTLLMRRAYANIGSPHDSSEVQQQLAREGIIQGDEGDYWLLDTPELHSSMLEAGNDVDADIEQGTYTRALAGQREPGIVTVGQQQILSSAARLKFAAPLFQLQHLASITASRILRLAEALDEPIGANGKTLRSGDINAYYDVRVSFEVDDPLLDIQRRQLGMQEVAGGLKDKETYWETDAREENVAQRKERLLRQAVREHPGVISQLALQQARLMGLDSEFNKALGEEQALLQGDGRRTPSLGVTGRENTSQLAAPPPGRPPGGDLTGAGNNTGPDLGG